MPRPQSHTMHLMIVTSNMLILNLVPGASTTIPLYPTVGLDLTWIIGLVGFSLTYARSNVSLAEIWVFSGTFSLSVQMPYPIPGICIRGAVVCRMR